jgi:hypothetical protein
MPPAEALKPVAPAPVVIDFSRRCRLVPKEALVFKTVDGENVTFVNVDALSFADRELFFKGLLTCPPPKL